MKRLIIAMFVLVLLGLLLIFDSHVTGQRRTSSNSNISSNTRPTLNRRRETNSRSSTNTGRMSNMQSMTLKESLTAEALQIAENYWKKILTKCGDTYYWLGAAHNEAKGEPTTYIQYSNYYPPKQLTTADKLNGVDPQPIEFDARSITKFDAGRFFSGDQCDVRVCPWKDDFNEAAIFLIKSKGQWHIRTIKGTENKPVKCKSDGAPLRGRQPINLDAYCKKTQDNLSRAIINKHWDPPWFCQHPDYGGGTQINMDEACQMQYGETFKAKYDRKSDPYSWYCIDY